jgi:hypothetical protein
VDGEASMTSVILAWHFLLLSPNREQLELWLIQGMWIVKNAIVEGRHEPEMEGALICVCNEHLRTIDPKGVPGPTWRIKMDPSKRPKQLSAFDSRDNLVMSAAYDLRPGRLILIYPYERLAQLLVLPWADRKNLPTVLVLVRASEH